MSNGLTVGKVEVQGRVWIAPMTGVSDLPFRETATRLGAAYVATISVAT
jgi:tRNA-dihydrouridine synthase B